MSGKCASCGAAVVWPLTPKGKRMPVDVEPVDNGNVTMLQMDDGEIHATVHGKPEDIPAGVERFTSHFATCPKAAHHRKRPS